jgi:hypothetical protein
MKLSSIREQLRWRGPWIVCLLAVREFFKPLFYWYVWNIYETDLSGEVPPPYSGQVLDVAIHNSHDDDVSSLMPKLLSLGEVSAAELETRLSRGDAVALASTAGQPVGYMWMGFSSGIELAYDTYWIIRPGEALRYGSFVIPQFRGRGVHSILNSALNSYAVKRGVTRSLGATSVLNPQSLSLPKHYNRAIAMTVFLARFHLLSFTLRKSFRAPLSSRFTSSANTFRAGVGAQRRANSR